MARKRIGDLLRSRGLVTEAELNQGLEAQRKTQKRLGVTLVELGLLSEEQLASALADALRLPRVDLAQVAVDWGAVHLLKAQFCEAHGLFPFALESTGGRKQLVAAMSDPLDVRAIEEIEFSTGLKLSPRVASLSGVRAAILRYYHRVQAPPPVGPPVQRRTADRRTPPSPETHEEPERSVSEDLDLLFGQEPAPPDPTRRIETLVRLLVRKGVLSEAEGRAALSGDDTGE